MTIYVFSCRLTGETQEIPVCDQHKKAMPEVNDFTISAYEADDDIQCDFCEAA